MKLRKILKSMWANYCRTFKDVPPGRHVLIKKTCFGGFFVPAGDEGRCQGGGCYYGGL